MSGQATILYPNNTLQIPLNVKDSIDVTYSSTWPSVNLTLLYRAATSQVYNYYNVPNNPLPANGTYLTTDIDDMKFGITAYPADCVFRLTQYGTNEISVDGGVFTLTSAEAAPRTFAISSTIGLSTTASSSSAATTSSGTSPTTSSAATVNTTSNADSPRPGGLGKSAAAAIGVGVTLGVLLIIAAITIYVLYTQRRRKSQANPAAGTITEKPELYGSGPAPIKSNWSVTFSTPRVEGHASVTTLPETELSPHESRSLMRHELA